jgi:acyl carrier protein
VLTPLHGPPTALADAVAFLGGTTGSVPMTGPAASAEPHVPRAPLDLADAEAPAPLAPAVSAESPAVSAELPTPRKRLSRDDIEAQIRTLYAVALEYPEEVFDPGAELEADLGVDSVKQTELMARLGELFALGPRPEGLRMGDYRTFGRLVDFVSESLFAANGAR